MAISLLSNALRTSTFKRLGYVRVSLQACEKRFIMSTRGRLEKVLEDLEKNPYFNKYAEKIMKLQQTSPEEFFQRVENQEKKLQEKKEKSQQERTFNLGQAKPRLGQGSRPNEVRLDSVMKLDLIENKTKDEIVEIWREYHKHKDYICGAMTAEQFEKMFERGKHYPTFLLPLPREQGYEFILIQFSGLEVYMTPLLCYQAHQENTPECLKMVHYAEMKESKGVILMRGEFDNKIISVQEAQCLANELQLYYCNDSPQRLHLLETFTNRPDEFKHMDLIAQLETIQLEMNKK